MLFLNQADIKKCIDMSGAIKALSQVFLSDYRLPLRTSFERTSSITHFMPAGIDKMQRFGIKIASHYPDNLNKGLSSINGLMLLFDDKTGIPLAIMDAKFLTGIRTAAVSALATDILAPKSASQLCILGSGRQAEFHLEAMQSIREIKKIHLWSRTKDHAQHLSQKYPKLNWLIHDKVVDACQDADIICTTTASHQVILKQSYLKNPKVHINAIGAHHPSMLEIDAKIFKHSVVVVEQKEAAFREAGDLIAAHINPQDVLELKDILKNEHHLSQRPTLFKSVGLAIEDLAVANWIYDQALQQKLGVNLE